MLRRHGRHIVIDWPTQGQKSYGEAISWCWDRGHTLLTIEHDLVPELEHLIALEACQQALICQQAYMLHFGSVASAAGVYAFRVATVDGMRWGELDEQWADWFTLGCTVFKPEAMARIGAWSAPDNDGWAAQDTWLSRFSRELGLRAHVHWPAIQHHHH